MPIEGPITTIIKETPVEGPIPKMMEQTEGIIPNMMGFKVPEFLKIDIDQVASDIKIWMEARVEDWYHFVGDIFESMVNLILYTPGMLIANPQVHMLWLIFISITVGIISILCVIEGIKTALGLSRTNFLHFVGRTVLAFCGIALILPGMTIGLDFINGFVKELTDMAFGNTSAGEYIGDNLTTVFTNGALGLLSSLVFMILFIYYMLRVLLNYGRRWFDIIISAIISPMAIGATVFSSTTHYFQKWWNHVLQLYLVQAVHAIYVTVIAVVVLTPTVLTGPVTGFMKILILIGALWRMSTPPSFVASMSGSPDSRDMLRQLSRKLIRNKVFKKGGK